MTDNRRFSQLPDGGYALTLSAGFRVEVRHLRRRDHSLIGEVEVFCDWPGARTFQGSLCCSDLNLSSQRERSGRATYLLARAGGSENEFDWAGLIDETCIRVTQADRAGEPAMRLDDIPAAPPDVDFHVGGLSLPSDSTTVLLADGGSMKSYLAIWILGCLSQEDIPVLYVDFEWSGARHRVRRDKLFSSTALPHLHYTRCYAPLTVELDRLLRYIRTHQIKYTVLDSIVPALDGKPEDADVANRFMAAAGRLPGALALAHVTKAAAGNPDPQAKPTAFGSQFFHNLCRKSYYAKKQQNLATRNVVTVGVFPTKSTEGPPDVAVGFEFSFESHRVAVQPVDLATNPELARSLPTQDRMRAELMHGVPLTAAELADRTESKVNTIIQTVLRKPLLFRKVVSSDGIDRIALTDKGF